MKKYILLALLIFPITSNAYYFNFGDGTETCYVYTDPVTFSTDITVPEIHIYNDAGDGDNKEPSATSPLSSWAVLDWSTTPTLPISVTRIIVYQNGTTNVYDEFIEFELAETCDTETPTATSTATSTASLGDISFGLAIIIALLSLGLIGFAFNSINLKKPWKG